MIRTRLAQKTGAKVYPASPCIAGAAGYVRPFIHLENYPAGMMGRCARMNEFIEQRIWNAEQYFGA